MIDHGLLLGGHLAVLERLELMKLLFEHGANPNARLKSAALQRAHTPGEPTLGEDATPLMGAAKKRRCRRDRDLDRAWRRCISRAEKPNHGADVRGGIGAR